MAYVFGIAPGRFLTVNHQPFDRHTIVKKTLQKALLSRNVLNLPLSVSGRSDTVLEIRDTTGNVVGNVTDKMLWMTEIESPIL